VTVEDVRAFMQWSGGDEPPVDPWKMPVLAMRLPTFFLGQFFHCPPHAWDHKSAEDVMLDYYIFTVFKEMEGKELEQIKRSQAVAQGKGRPVKTTSDADFFDRMNAKMR